MLQSCIVYQMSFNIFPEYLSSVAPQLIKNTNYDIRDPSQQAYIGPLTAFGGHLGIPAPWRAARGPK